MQRCVKTYSVLPVGTAVLGITNIVCKHLAVLSLLSANTNNEPAQCLLVSLCSRGIATSGGGGGGGACAPTNL